MPRIPDVQLPEPVPEAVKAFGSPVHVGILEYLHRVDAVGSSTIAEQLNLPTPTVATALARLERLEVVIGTPAPTQRRAGQRVRWSSRSDTVRNLLGELSSYLLPEE